MIYRLVFQLIIHLQFQRNYGVSTSKRRANLISSRIMWERPSLCPDPRRCVLLRVHYAKSINGSRKNSRLKAMIPSWPRFKVKTLSVACVGRKRIAWCNPLLGELVPKTLPAKLFPGQKKFKEAGTQKLTGVKSEKPARLLCQNWLAGSELKFA